MRSLIAAVALMIATTVWSEMTVTIYSPWGEKMLTITNVFRIDWDHEHKVPPCHLVWSVQNGQTNQFHAWCVDLKIGTNAPKRTIRVEAEPAIANPVYATVKVEDDGIPNWQPMEGGTATNGISATQIEGFTVTNWLTFEWADRTNSISLTREEVTNIVLSLLRDRQWR